jgi:sec-independent protein translocase protein TatB
VGLVSLLVIGPEKLPQVARFVGFWLGKIRHMVTSVKQEFKEELYAEEVRQLLKQQSDMLEQLDLKSRGVQALVAEEVQQLQAGLVKSITDLELAQPKPHVNPLPEPLPDKAKLPAKPAGEASIQPVPAPLPVNRPKSKKHRRHGKK